MRKNLLVGISLLAAASLLAGCCLVKPEPAVETPEATKVPFRVGMVTDLGGIDDKSFNATAWKGCQDAQAELGIEAQYLESQQQTDYAPNITQFLDQDYNMIVTVGWMLSADTYTFAKENPDVPFAIVDFGWAPGMWDEATNPRLDNVRGLIFSTDQAAFLAGYLAAGMSQTGKVGTWGGIPIPTVTIFMVGFQAGVEYYNQQHGTAVEVLGWDTATGQGTFINNFESTDDGRRVTEDLISEGADVILPVAGPAGLGAGAAIMENPGVMLIGVDADWCVSADEYCSATLTSVMKNMDVAVLEAVRMAHEGAFEGGTNYVGTLDNNGVAIAPFHEFEDKVPAELATELDTIKAGIIGGTIDTGWEGYLAAQSQ
jgi:basic membrane protein A